MTINRSQLHWFHPRNARLIQHTHINKFICRIVDGNHKFIAKDAKVSFGEVQYIFMIKVLKKLVTVGTYLNIRYVRQTYDQRYSQWENIEVFSCQIQNKCSHTFCFYSV